MDAGVFFKVHSAKFLEPVGPELGMQCFEAGYMKGTAVLRGVTAVFREAYLDAVARQPLTGEGPISR